jgi:DNA-binding HxlR family transcriptional regulator
MIKQDGDAALSRQECAALATFDVIAHRWSSLVLYALSRGIRRTSELRADIPDITPKVLTETLRRLERDGLLARSDLSTSVRRVEYELTPLGEAAQSLLSVTCAWGKEHLPEIDEARRAFDLRGAPRSDSFR